jgi:ligand-binding SRPBCC domain-containing protein
MRVRSFEAEQWFPLKQEELFVFLADVANLEAITPGFLNFRVVTPLPIVMGQGRLIDYKLRVRGIPVRWRSKITAWQPPSRFVDEQVRGPYRLWIHEHILEPRDGGTVMRDRVRFALWFDFLTARFVRRDIEAIFKYRRNMLRARLHGNLR